MYQYKLPEKKPFVKDILRWYKNHKRDLPWRKHQKNPYYVWLSEMMLQQTTVTTVLPYFEKFITKWPTIDRLAQSTQDDVLAAWAGLGYYARARNLHKCAQTITSDYQGHFPQNYDELKKLPGIGPYSAAAIAAIAFGSSDVVIDGNIERIMCRVGVIETPIVQSKSVIREMASALTPQNNNGDYIQALMDISAQICRPKNPKCLICPIRKHCQALSNNRTDELPKKLPKKNKPYKYATIYWVEKNGKIMMRKRPEKGLLGGMIEFPSTSWTDKKPSQNEWKKQAPCEADWTLHKKTIKHSFTHFDIELQIVTAQNFQKIKAQEFEAQWFEANHIYDLALPTIMRKVADAKLK